MNRFTDPTQILDLTVLTLANIASHSRLLLCKINLLMEKKRKPPAKFIEKLNTEFTSSVSTKTLCKNQQVHKIVNNQSNREK